MSRPTDKVRTARLGALGFTALALVLTGLTALLLSRMIGSSRYANEPLKEIVVAERNLPASDVIALGDLKVVRWPASSVPDGAFKTTEALLAGGPRVPVSTILAGEPVLAARLADADAGTGMASLVPRNLRGFPIPVEGWIAKARLVYPGAVVDVLSTMKDPVERKPVTKLVLQKVQVLAVNGAVDAAAAEPKKKKRRFGKRTKSKAVVTLLVTPDQAEALALSTREGKLDLMLRNAGDEAVVETEGISPSELLAGPDAGAGTVKASKARRRRSPQRRKVAKARAERPERRVAMNSRRGRRGGGAKTIRLGAR